MRRDAAVPKRIATDGTAPQERRMRRDGGGSERHRGVAAAPTKNRMAVVRKPAALPPLPAPQNPCFSISR